jgi:hypothetical protein
MQPALYKEPNALPSDSIACGSPPPDSASVPPLAPPPRNRNEGLPVTPRYEFAHIYEDSVGFENPMNLKQSDLAEACRRVRAPSGGTKAELVKRLKERGALTLRQVQDLVKLYRDAGREEVGHSRLVSSREPRGSEGESFRLISIISDPKHATAVHFLYNKPEDRSGLDVPRVDPFAESFRIQFNDEMFEPEAPDAALGITEDILDEMAACACDRPNVRNGTVLKAR